MKLDNGMPHFGWILSIGRLRLQHLGDDMRCWIKPHLAGPFGTIQSRTLFWLRFAAWITP